MKNRSRILALVAIATLVVVGALWLVGRHDSSVTQNYKAGLRAKGEKLSFAELGFPRQPKNLESLIRLTNAVQRIPAGNISPGDLAQMRFDGADKIQPLWARPKLLLMDYTTKATSEIEWDELAAELRGMINELAAIRSAVEQPTDCYLYDPLSARTNGTRYPFVPMRTAAHWLSADAISALQANDRIRARQDIHALAQLTEFNKDDPTLVAHMIRVAMAGLGLTATWELLQARGWSELELAGLQQDWERVDLLEVLERGMLGERANGDAFFADVRAYGATRPIGQILSITRVASAKGLHARLITWLWGMSAAQDELLLFQHYQGLLENARALRNQTPWLEVDAKNGLLATNFNKVVGAATGIRKYQYLVCCTVIPNYTKAAQTAARNETLRRLTVTAIALKRHELRQGRLPMELRDLTPDFLTTVPIDPMSGQPLRYRLNADGRFTLYSVGMDGKDDKGDSNPSGPVKQYDLWSGRDTVWPESHHNP